MKAKLGALLVVATLGFGLVGLSGCSETAGQKAARQANAQIDQMNAIDKTLQADGINIDTTGTADQSRTLPDLDATKLRDDRALLSLYVSLGQSVMATAKRSDVNVRKIKNRPDIVSSTQNGVNDANFWIGKIDQQKTKH